MCPRSSPGADRGCADANTGSLTHTLPCSGRAVAGGRGLHGGYAAGGRIFEYGQGGEYAGHDADLAYCGAMEGADFRAIPVIADLRSDTVTQPTVRCECVAFPNPARGSRRRAPPPSADPAMIHWLDLCHPCPARRPPLPPGRQTNSNLSPHCVASPAPLSPPPQQAMREAMMNAQVDDDVLGRDPTTAYLEGEARRDSTDMPLHSFMPPQPSFWLPRAARGCACPTLLRPLTRRRFAPPSLTTDRQDHGQGGCALRPLRDHGQPHRRPHPLRRALPFLCCMHSPSLSA